MLLLGFYIGLLVTPITSHIPDYITTPSSRVEQACVRADGCFHDTVAVCGTMGGETRSFLDECDMYEYSCDNNLFYTHIEDTDDCPAPLIPG